MNETPRETLLYALFHVTDHERNVEWLQVKNWYEVAKTILIKILFAPVRTLHEFMVRIAIWLRYIGGFIIYAYWRADRMVFDDNTLLLRSWLYFLNVALFYNVWLITAIRRNNLLRRSTTNAEEIARLLTIKHKRWERAWKFELVLAAWFVLWIGFSVVWLTLV